MKPADTRRLLRPCLGVLFFGLVRELTRRGRSLVDDEAMLVFVKKLATGLFGTSGGPGVQALMYLASYWAGHPGSTSLDLRLDSEAIAFFREVGFSVNFHPTDPGRYVVRCDSKILRQSWDGPAVYRVFAAAEQHQLAAYPPKKHRDRPSKIGGAP